MPNAPNKSRLIGYGIGIAILLLALLGLIFGTQKAEVDPIVKELKKIFKNHGTRLVALDSDTIAPDEHLSKVHSIDDLVRISDELGKPIVYKHSNDYKENTRFWVFDENRYYVFDLKESINWRQFQLPKGKDKAFFT